MSVPAGGPAGDYWLPGVVVANRPGGQGLAEAPVWRRGRSFRLSRLETRLRCPMCGSREVRLIFTVPRETQTVRGAKLGPK
jgi:hypothetical protein